MQLNQGQQAAADGFFEFLMGPEPELIISGPGGVGKTFLMGHLIDTIMPRYHEICSIMGQPAIYQEVMMTATTNKAAEVLGQSTGRPTKTIHSHLGLRVYDDYKTGQTKLTRGKNWKVQSNQVIFIDEASMIDTPLLQMIQEGTIQSKIVYVGDHCQLAPVKESLSPIYRRELPFFELTQPMRNSGQPALMAICNQLRQTVETGEFRPIHAVPGVIDHLDGIQMQAEIAAHFEDPGNHHRILAYTNNQAIAYNDHIREMRGLPPTYSVGEMVVNNTAIFQGNKMMSVEDEFEIVSVGEPTLYDLTHEVNLEVLPISLVGRHGSFDVQVPTDKGYFSQLMKHFVSRKDWPNYYHLKETFPDLRPRDAATVHKAQGSTYDTVFIDLDDLSTCRNPTVAARLLYVAFSRAQRRVVLYGKLAPKFGGVVS